MKKIKIGSTLGKHFNPRYYEVHSNQDLPKPQVNCEYYTYTTEGWVELYYHNNVFYRSINRSVDSFWLFYLTATKSDIIKGDQLQGVPSVYLNAEGRRLAWAYRTHIKHEALQRQARLHIFQVRKRLK